jgi:hypothetical protein
MISADSRQKHAVGWLPDNETSLVFVMEARRLF